MALERIFDTVCTPDREVDPELLQSVLELAVEIAREGREGRKIGTMFVVGASSSVLELSRPLVLDPLAGHSREVKRLAHPDMRETVKELAQLDGGFVVSEEGVVLSACRYFEAPSRGVRVPLGLGTRHMAAAAVSRATRAVAIVVSTSAMVRVFDDGRIVGEILPELWLISRQSLYIDHPHIQERPQENVTVVTNERDLDGAETGT